MTTSNHSSSLDERIVALCAELTGKSKTPERTFWSEFSADFSGRRFVRISHQHVHDDGQRADTRYVHAFVDRTNGDIIKDGGWKSPQRSRTGVLAVRGNLLDDADFARLLRWCDPYGSYLYADRGGK